jgi:hypothetical protein
VEEHDEGPGHDVPRRDGPEQGVLQHDGAAGHHPVGVELAQGPSETGRRRHMVFVNVHGQFGIATGAKVSGHASSPTSCPGFRSAVETAALRPIGSDALSQDRPRASGSVQVYPLAWSPYSLRSNSRHWPAACCTASQATVSSASLGAETVMKPA